jgi:Cu+-exporting ATPase
MQAHFKTNVYLHFKPQSDKYKYMNMSEKTQRILFRIIGMYCITCRPIVEKQLRDERAVKRIDIDYMTDSVIVEFDSSLITTEEIQNRLEKSSYKFVRTAH